MSEICSSCGDPNRDDPLKSSSLSSGRLSFYLSRLGLAAGALAGMQTVEMSRRVEDHDWRSCKS